MTLSYTQQQELASFCNSLELTKVLCVRRKTFFRLFCHITHYLVHWAKTDTAAIEIFPNAHQR